MKPIGHPDTFSVDSIGHPDTPPIGHPDTQWCLEPPPRLAFRIHNYARASLTLLKAFNACQRGGESATRRLPFGILPSPRRLRRRPAASVLPAKSAAIMGASVLPGSLRCHGKGTPRKSVGSVLRTLCPWRTSRRFSFVARPHGARCAIVCNDARGYARGCTHAQFCANRATRCTCVHIVAHSCEELDGKMCNVPVRGEPRPFHYCPYSRFALDDILLCEAGGGRCGPDGRHA